MTGSIFQVTQEKEEDDEPEWDFRCPVSKYQYMRDGVCVGVSVTEVWDGAWMQVEYVSLRGFHFNLSLC